MVSPISLNAQASFFDSNIKSYPFFIRKISNTRLQLEEDAENDSKYVGFEGRKLTHEEEMRELQKMRQREISRLMEKKQIERMEIENKARLSGKDRVKQDIKEKLWGKNEKTTDQKNIPKSSPVV